MIDTLMVLWNRGSRSRGSLALLAFLLICISVSLLLIIVGGIKSHGPAPTNAARNRSAPRNQTPVVSVPSLIIPTQSNQVKKHHRPRHKPTPVPATATPVATATAGRCGRTPVMSNIVRAELKPRDGGPGGCCTNCLNNSIGVGDASLLSSLSSYLWIIMGVSGLGALLFYGAMSMACRRRGAQ
jgi:hypothetical protein